MQVKKYLNMLIKEAMYTKTSDIHFILENQDVLVYFRSTNNLVLQGKIKIEDYITLVRYVKFISKLDICLTNSPQDGSFSLTEVENIFFRVSTLPIYGGESLVIRIIYSIDLNSIKFSTLHENELNSFYEHIKQNRGLYIFTGPTGSGKTTLMYYLLSKLNKQENYKVITIENPIEIINSNFTQVQVGEKSSIDYKNALISSLRQDPDVIMIGEIRDEEVARNVFRASLTGHTVLTTMHTKNKKGVIERFIDFGFLQSEIKSILQGISNQRLIKDRNNINAVLDLAYGDEIEELFNEEYTELSIEQKFK